MAGASIAPGSSVTLMASPAFSPADRRSARTPRATAPRRARRRAYPSPPAQSEPAPGSRRGFSSSERASDLRRCAKPSLTTADSSSDAAGPFLVSRSSAEATRGRGTNTAGSTVRSISTSQASWTRTLGEPYVLRAGLRAQPVGDLALHHHHPGLEARQFRDRPDQERGCDRVGQVGDHLVGRRRQALRGPGASRRPRSARRRPPARASASSCLRSRLSISITCSAADLRSEALGQGAAAAPHLEHDVGRARAPPRGRSPPADWGRRGSSGPAGAATAPADRRGRSPPEDSRGVRLHGAFERTVRDAADLGEPLGGGDHVRGLIRLSAHRLGREEGRIGLDQQPILRDDRGRLADRLGLRIGEVARERAVPAALGRPLGPGRAGREAVQDRR